jgi:hypothetical protein
LGRSAGSFFSNTNTNTNTNAYIGLDVIMTAADATERIGNNNNNNDAAAASAPISLPPNRFELEVSPVFFTNRLTRSISSSHMNVCNRVVL